MSDNKDGLVGWIKSFSDPNERSRAMLQACMVNDNDPEVAALMRHAAIGDGPYSRVMASLLRPEKKRRGRDKTERQFDRIRPHHPALCGLKYVPVKEAPLEKVYGATLSQRIGYSESQLKARPSEEKRAIDFGLAAHLYENSKRIWSHLPDLKFDPPPGYRPREPMVNPFRPVPPTELSASPRMRESYLGTLEVRKIYNAMSYAMLKDGVVMNTHLVFIWSMMGLSPAEGSVILGKYLHGAQKWLRVGAQPRKRYSAKARMGTELRYVWAHENSPARGFHSHVLLHLPFGMRRDFEVWSRSYLVKLLGKHFVWKAFRLVPSYAKSEHDQVRRAWSWFRYITKELHPHAKFRWINYEKQYCERSMRDIVKPWPYRDSLPVPWMKLTGVSHNIGERCQCEDGFVSMLSNCEFELLYSGDELEQRRNRLAFERRRVELLNTLHI